MSSSTSFGSGVMGSGPLGSSPFYNVSEIIDGILYATGHGTPSAETTKRAAILYFVNNRYQEICLGYHWRWMQASYDTTFEAPYETGTVSVTNGDATVTGSGTTFSANLTPKDIFHIVGKNQVYHIASVASATSLELETEWAEDTATAQSYKTGTNQYELPVTTDHLISVIVDSQHKMMPLGTQDFRLLQSRNPTRFDRPMYYSMVRRDTDDDSIYMEVFPTPDQMYQVHIDYQVRILKLSDATTCYPIIPDRYRAVLFHGALADFLNHFYKGESGKAQNEFQQYYAMLNAMRNDKQIADQDLQLIPNRDYFGRGIVSKSKVDIDDFKRGL